MKKRRSYTYTGIIAALLCALMILGSILPATAAEPEASLNYGIAGWNNRTVSATQLYGMLFSGAPTAAEKSYLETTGITLQYNDIALGNNISTHYDGEAGTLDVVLPTYVYVAENGERVTWVPQEITVGGETYSLTADGDVYRCRMENMFYSANFSMEVSYLWRVEIPEDAINELRNCAYYAGAEVQERQRAYEALLAQYNHQLAAHQLYQERLKWEAEFAEYQKKKAAYDLLKNAYDTYVEENKTYLAEKDAYERWTAYFEYQDFVINHLESYNAYQTYLKSLDPIKAKLALMEMVFTSDSRGWQIYGDIMGSVVTTVIGRKDELIVAGANGAEVDLAGASTENLRVLLSGYNELRKAKYPSEHARIEALYGYYTKNYEALRENFKNLYSPLYSLYTGNTLVRNFIRMQGKLEHYLQLVGALYVVSTCLDDTGNRNASWKISGQSLSQVVEASQLIKDTNNFDPANSPMPKEVAPVEWVEPKEKPDVPMPESIPVPPSPVADPGPAPTPVKDPATEQRPPEVAHPGTPPTPPAFTALERALLQEVQEGTLKKKADVVAPIMLEFSKVATRSVSFKNQKMVTFYNWDGSIYHQTMVDYGGNAFCQIPDRADTPEYSYRKLAWVSVDGNDVDLSMIRTDLSLYPLYEASKRTYTVTWILDGEETKTSHLYGSMPEPPMPLTRPDGPYHTYAFSGWDKPLATVTGDVTYTGSIRQVPKKFEITWVVNDGKTRIVEEWAYGTVPTFSGDLSVASTTHSYTFLGWDKTPAVVTGPLTYTAVYRATPLAGGTTSEESVLEVLEGETSLTVMAGHSALNIDGAIRAAIEKQKALEISWEGGVKLTLEKDSLAMFASSVCERIFLEKGAAQGGATVYRVCFYDGAWNAINTLPVSVEVTLPYEKTEVCESVFLVQTEESWVYAESNRITLTGSTVIRRELSNRIKVMPNENCNTMSMVKNAIPGERISLKLSCLFGYEVSGAHITAADGTTVLLDPDLSFVMPASPVEIELVVTPVVYKVSFLVDGKVWDTKEYGLGEEILLPADPTKEAEEGFIYSFVGWGTVPAIASGEARELEFHAEFSLAQENVVYESGNNNDILITVVLPIFLGCIVLLVVVIILLKRRKKKKRIAAQRGHAPVEQPRRVRRVAKAPVREAPRAARPAPAPVRTAAARPTRTVTVKQTPPPAEPTSPAVQAPPANPTPTVSAPELPLSGVPAAGIFGKKMEDRLSHTAEAEPAPETAASVSEMLLRAQKDTLLKGEQPAEETATAAEETATAAEEERNTSAALPEEMQLLDAEDETQKTDAQ